MNDGVESNELLSGLTVEGLYDIAEQASREKPRLLIRPEDKVESILRQTEPAIAGFVDMGEPFWFEFKREFRILLCTKDKKYASVRKTLSSSSDKSQLAIVSTIAAAIASSWGIVAASLVPFCAICLIAALKMGKEAFCKAETLDVTVGSEKHKS
jgi:hypothetical protein